MNLLFVCSRNKIRSVTAERMYARHPRLSVRSAGTADSAAHRISAGDVAWADIIFAFEHRHKQQIAARFRALLSGERPLVVVLDIPDEYGLMDAELMEEIQAQVDPYLMDVDHAEEEDEAA